MLAMHAMVNSVSVNLWLWLINLFFPADKTCLDLDYSGYHKRKRIWSWINWEGFINFFMHFSSDVPLISDSFHVFVFLGLLLWGSRQVYKKASQSWRFTETSLGISRDICTGSTRTCQGKKEPGNERAVTYKIHIQIPTTVFHTFSVMYLGKNWFLIKTEVFNRIRHLCFV